VSGPTPAPAELAAGLCAGDRAALGRALTLVESRAPRHGSAARELLRLLLPRSGGAIRLGLSGVPGVGKSSFIEALGLELLGRGHRVAVLAIDPSSTVTGGSILGDKARMDGLAQAPGAFVRPSPSAATLGGVARRTREALVVVEAAGYDVVLVETVGVGQSETAVAQMVDTFCVLLLPGAGDELQGIKRGILELADLLVVHKADGDNLPRAEAAAAELRAALHYLRAADPRWQPRLHLASAHGRTGLGAVWQSVLDHRAALGPERLAERRAEQRRVWLWDQIHEALGERFVHHPAVRERLTILERAVTAGEVLPSAAAEELLERFGLVAG
jgi:LAO/AO transport system kinase